MNIKMIQSILREYGLSWVINRSMYSAKLKMLNIIPKTEKLFEKKVAYPQRLDLFDIDIAYLKEFIRGLSPVDRKELIEKADRACEGKIQGFCWIDLDYGHPVNWQLNPLTGKACSVSRKWFQIPDFDVERGDIKVVWEISRFMHFIILARAYLLTEDEKYYKAFSQQLDHWLEQNPYSYGASYKCGQECALRMVNALFAYTIFAKCGKATAADKENIKRLIIRCFRKIQSNFFYAHKCIKNNHTISELVGMIVGSWCCNDEKQLAYAFKTFDETVDEQFTEDGGYTQYSFNYTRLALQNIEVVLAVEQKTGYQLNAVSRGKIQNAVNLMYQCQNKYGYMPNYGSNDGALVYPFTSCEYRDFRPVLSAVQVLLTGENLYPSGKYEEEQIWLGRRKTDCFRQKKQKRNSAAFRQAGIYTLRNGDAWMMLVLNNYKLRPAHMDQMHIDLWINEENVLCDSGTYSYADELGKQLVSNVSHNTVIFDKKTQMDVKGAFLIYNWTKCGQIKVGKDSFCGEMRSVNKYSHKRSVKFTDARYQVVDSVKGKEGSSFEIRFHTPCEIEVEDKNTINLIQNGSKICSMKFNASFHIYKSVRSLYYLKSEEINCIAVSSKIQEGSNIKTEIKYGGVL